jgi:hypothetical protein
LIYAAEFGRMVVLGRDEMAKRITCRVVRSVPLGEGWRSGRSSQNRRKASSSRSYARFYQADYPVSDCKFEDAVCQPAIYANRSGAVKLSFDQEETARTFDCYA